MDRPGQDKSQGIPVLMHAEMVWLKPLELPHYGRSGMCHSRSEQDSSLTGTSWVQLSLAELHESAVGIEVSMCDWFRSG